MKNKTMNELGFRIMWRIMQILEDVIHRNMFPPSAKFFILLSLTQQLSNYFLKK